MGQRPGLPARIFGWIQRRRPNLGFSEGASLSPLAPGALPLPGQNVATSQGSAKAWPTIIEIGQTLAR